MIFKKQNRSANIKNDLSKFKTCELVEELKKREGVKTTIVAVGTTEYKHTDGPAIVLEVID